ncbi:MAG TPA: hypothetical protein PKD21_06270 [Candidatus Competibacter phosphatis]|nr:hypothetical protein [Candidatus Competibacter phosphatis]
MAMIKYSKKNLVSVMQALQIIFSQPKFISGLLYPISVFAQVILAVIKLQNMTVEKAIPLIKNALKVSPMRSKKMDEFLEAVLYELT